jgi:hypothetical protein
MRDGDGMSDRGVWFAGEHTAPFVALGTVTGAWWSGEGVAGRIAAAYGRGDKQKNGEMMAQNTNGDFDKDSGIEMDREVSIRAFAGVMET